MPLIYYTNKKPNCAIIVNGRKVRFEDVHSKSDFLRLLVEGMTGAKPIESTVIEKEVNSVTIAKNQDGEIVYLKIDP